VRSSFALPVALAVVCASTVSSAEEGFALAGPIGGTDMRSAQLPPPGLYGGAIYVHAESRGFYDGDGNSVPALRDLEFSSDIAQAFLVYVPDVQVLGGSVGIAGLTSIGVNCGRVFEVEPERCIAGFGDIYVEMDWSRHFGHLRPSRDADAYPIPEGLTVALGFGVLFPSGRYDASEATTKALRIGNNLWDFAPTIAATYTTEPILAEGTEFSARLYWNNYLKNPDTDYASGSLIDIDFAITERIGRFQAGLAGIYDIQVEDDEQFGRPVATDGRRVQALLLGPVVAVDFPEYGSSIRVKALASVLSENATRQYGVVFGWVRQF
jgi:hypothetical protein